MRNGKTVLFGAMGRHNFGDMIMPHIIQKLTGESYTVADLKERDMTEYGGHKVVSIDSLFDSDEPVNVVLLGGEVGGCKRDWGMQMLGECPNSADTDLAYILPKSKFKNPGVFIANSIGGTSLQAAEYLADYDYVSFRDSSSMIVGSNHVPDCAVMVRELFDDRIQDSSEKVLEMRESMGDYIAVQVSEAVLKKSGWEIYEQLESLMNEMDLPIVLFCAGIAPGHDSLESYANEFGGNFPSGMAWYSDDYNIWSICNIIANAKMFVGTSLHAHIVASVYGVPCISIGCKQKVLAFNNEWTPFRPDFLRNEYMNSFSEWNSLLLRGARNK